MRYTSVRYLIIILVITTVTVFLTPPAAVRAAGTVTNCTTFNDGVLPADTLGELLPSGGLITFACSGVINAAGTTSTAPNITVNTTISAVGQNVRLVAGDTQRIFIIDAAATVTLDTLTLDAGANFPAVVNFGFLTFRNSAVVDSVGGGIFNGGSTLISSSQFSNSRQPIDNAGLMSIQQSSITNNAPLGAIRNTGELTVFSTTLTGNSRNPSDGGAIYNEGSLTLVAAVISNNSAAGCGGGVANQGGTVSFTNGGPTANTASSGGGVCSFNGSLTIVESEIEGNTASVAGGGIFGSGGSLSLDRSAVLLNQAASGAGVRFTGSMTIVNTTFSGNTASGNGGGLYIRVCPGSSASLIYTSFVNNQAGAGRAIYHENCGEPVSIQKSLIAHSSAANNCFGPFVNAGYNLTTDAGCAGFGLTTFTQLQLSSLLPNGGFTRTHGLGQGSSAIDAVPLSQCGLTLDQRLSARPVGNGCDAGAYESPYFATLAGGAPILNSYETASPTLTWNRVSWAAGYEIQVDTTPAFSGSPFVQAVAANTLTFTLPLSLNNGIHYWRIRAKRADGSWGSWSQPQPFVVVVAA